MSPSKTAQLIEVPFLVGLRWNLGTLYWVEYESLVGRGTLKVLGIVIFIKSFVYKKK